MMRLNSAHLQTRQLSFTAKIMYEKMKLLWPSASFSSALCCWAMLLCLLAGAGCVKEEKAWRRPDSHKMQRLLDSSSQITDDIAANPLDVELLSRLEVMCKDHGDHNSRFRILQTMLRIDPHLIDWIGIHFAYAIGDRLYSHAKACRFEQRERDLDTFISMWRRGQWDFAMRQGTTLPVLPFYSLVFDFDMQQVTLISKSWAEKFGNYTKREELPSPFSNVYLREFSQSRMLKVGYVSSDIYRVHPVGKSINALLRMLDPAQFEVYAFLLLGSQLEEASELENGTGGVMMVDLSISSSAEAAFNINSEGIHVLIDLNGHTSGVITPPSIIDISLASKF
jgi:hypothetical protein